MSNDRPTLKTIAYMTGLGVTTVSKALNDAPDIGEQTKERVRLIARQVGYRPNRAGVRLRTGKTNVIALVLNVEEEIMGLTAHLVYGISAQLRDTSYHLVVTPYSHSNDPMDPVRYIVETGSADGLIFSRTQREDPRARYLHEHHFPFATHGRTTMGIEHPWHDFDNYAYAQQAVRSLAERGRKRLALLAPTPLLTFYDHMTSGFTDTVSELGISGSVISAANIDMPLRAIREHVAGLLRSRTPPDGIVCGSGASTVAIASAIDDAGLKLGKDIDLAGKQFLDVLNWIRPEIIAFHEDVRLAGVHLARAVIGAIEGKNPKELQTLSLPTLATITGPEGRETGRAAASV